MNWIELDSLGKGKEIKNAQKNVHNAQISVHTGIRIIGVTSCL